MKKISVLIFILLISVVFATNGVIPVKVQQPEVKKAFPYDIAGFGVWIKLSSTPNFKVIGNLFEQVVEVGDNYVLGWTTKSGSTKVKVYIYADSDGYLVTFLDKQTPPSAIVNFSSIDFDKKQILNFTVLKVMEDVLSALGYNYSDMFPNIRFADFQHKDANEFVIAIVRTKPLTKIENTNITIPKEENLHIAISDKVKIYSYSYIWAYTGLYIHDRIDTRHLLYIDTQKIDDAWASWKSTYLYSRYLWTDLKDVVLKLPFTPTIPHTFKIGTYYNSRSKMALKETTTELAIVVVYKK